jgi:hypothetical protein
MIAALLAAGPSLRRTWRPLVDTRYDLTIAVNTTISLLNQFGERYDWAVAIDEHALTLWLKDAHPVEGFVLCRSECRQGKRMAGEPAHVCSDDLPGAHGGSIGGFYWSILAALAHARSLGCDFVDLYGVDWEGTVDCTGLEEARTRTPVRWRDEQSAVRDYAIHHGMHLNRVMPC